MKVFINIFQKGWLTTIHQVSKQKSITFLKILFWLSFPFFRILTARRRLSIRGRLSLQGGREYSHDLALGTPTTFYYKSVGTGVPAVGIETHNRNGEGYKADPSLKNVYVLASAFVDGENIIPVKLEVKEFSDKENTLYVAIALESIKKERDRKARGRHEWRCPTILSLVHY